MSRSASSHFTPFALARRDDATHPIYAARMTMCDPHSFSDDTQPSTKHIDLDLVVDFDRRVLFGTATLTFDRPADGVIDLDVRELAIESVKHADGTSARHDLDVTDPIKGSRLRIATTSDRIAIRYATTHASTALQWLAPAQTRGGRRPFVFTQCQAIHARSIVPCQDTPRIRVTFDARIEVPSGLHALMAARSLGVVSASNDRTVFRFEMRQAIPSYLIALAAGDLASRDLGERTRVWSEPEILEAAAYEFANIDRILYAAEDLFGPYPWERFDILVMPPSFPYGGMENPRLTFVTPTLLAGDRSLVDVVAHELAHAWTGNLVTNASMNDFWLNEGFTVYAERRILERIDGPEHSALHAALGAEALARDLARIGAMSPALTRLENDLSGIDPDDAFSRIPYEKGYLFLRRIEDVVGRPAFDGFLRSYIDRFRFRSIHTSDFVEFLVTAFPNIASAIDLEVWLHGSGLPADAPTTQAPKLDAVRALAADFVRGATTRDALARLDAMAWQVFLAELPRELPRERCAWLDGHFSLTTSKNAEILVAWLEIAAASSYEPAHAAIARTLLEIGRMKYLRPLYTALCANGDAARRLAIDTFATARSRYHPVARAMVEGILASHTEPA